ncbi:PD-(D/E)XK nuclease family protein [Patescibacteria group bacterium]|nr:PD-(D/E)XK nuclease family protein [Nanoarchaeota archaeon]MBU1706006.1 PD-(D/E)XK nuclease family protein [Patescibacteria group bacterium]
MVQANNSKYKFSPSSLSLLKDCPRCFWLKFNKDIKRPDTIFPSLPSGMDKILKVHFDYFMKKGKLPPELSELKGYKLFDDEELLKVWRSNFKGIQWTDKKGNLFRGAVDNILVKGKKMIVLDYKTRGYPLKEDTHEHYQDQMDIYNFLLRKNGYETEYYTYLIFYHPHKVEENGHVCFNTDIVKIKVDIKNAENIFNNAVKCLEGEMPEASEECGFCKWAKKSN